MDLSFLADEKFWAGFLGTLTIIGAGYRALQKQIAEARKKTEANEQKVNTTESKVSNIEHKVEVTQLTVQSAAKESAAGLTLQGMTIEKVMAQIETLVEKYTSLQEGYRRLEAENQRQSKFIDDLQEERLAWQVERAALTARIAELERSHTAEMSAVKIELEQLRAKNRELEQINQRLSAQVSVIERKGTTGNLTLHTEGV